ncbi:Hypothetical protein, putative, partial [Bodo saltans]
SQGYCHQFRVQPRRRAAEGDRGALPHPDRGAPHGLRRLPWRISFQSTRWLRHAEQKQRKKKSKISTTRNSDLR